MSRPRLMAYSRELEESSYFKMERACSEMANRISGHDDSIASGDLLILDNSHAENSSSTGPSYSCTAIVPNEHSAFIQH
jgi:hypothetical protein